jgi:succinate dehydrogenase/fumarate reductase flavoprotein subunit
MRDVDVLVVGSGAAGLCAAISARQAGATVLIAESEGEVGGSSRLSGGVVMGAGTALQAAAGIDDDAERLYREYMALNQWQVVPGLVRRFADESGATVDWLVSLGVAFHDELIVGGDESRPRSHLAKGGGQGLVDALRRAATELGIDIALGRRVDRLLTDGTGAVTGAAVGDDEITAGATVITTGGFGANRSLLHERFPSVCHEDWTWYIGADGSRGDAFTLVAPIDGATEGHDRGLRTLEPHWIHRNEAMTPGWMVYVDGRARRFIDETAPYGLLDAMVGSRGNAVYAIFDDAAIHPDPDRAAFYRHAYKAVWPGHGPFEPRNWSGDVVDAVVAEGRLVPHDSIAGLAEAIGVDPTALVGTIERYNRFGVEGRDADFGKAGRFLAPVARPPFYGVLVRPTVVNLTASGLRIDADTRVLTNRGTPLPGLHAAGECVGGIIGPVYVGSGNSLGTCTTIGRVAGRTAATTSAGAS